MLRGLQISNYILLDSLEVAFPEGLVIVSGSTGAGKSILLGAVDILLGGKTDVSLLRDTEKNCVIEGEFVLSNAEDGLVQLLKEDDIDFDGELLIRRQIAPSGRSRAFINDIPVSAGILQEIAPYLIDIHSQHQTLQISKDDFRLGALDSYMGKPALLADVASLFFDKRSLEGRLATLKETIARVLREGDYNASLLEELRGASLQEGEQEELEEELKVLENAETIKESLYACSSALCGSSDEGVGVGVALKEALKQLRFLEKYYSSMTDFASRLESAKCEIEDIAAEIESLNDRISLSAERLQFVEERLSTIYRLEKKHNVSSVPELITLRDRLAGEVFASEDLQEEITQTEREYTKVSKAYKEACAALHAARKEAAVSFAARIQARLHALEMSSAVFAIELVPRVESALGTDKVTFLFSSVGGTRHSEAESREPLRHSEGSIATEESNVKLVDVGTKASGGELSRIMLAIKAELASRRSTLPTMVFDEIDTGISGSVADKTGRMICEMGSSMQVFAITHLPQVAAKGSAHFLVAKSPEGVTTVSQISGEERVMEIARMLSGSEITPEAIANAKSLLG